MKCKISVVIDVKNPRTKPFLYEEALKPDNDTNIHISSKKDELKICIDNLKINGFSSVVEEILKSIQIVDSI